MGTTGYPLEIPYDNGINAPQSIRTLMYFSNELTSRYPSGNYRLIVEGTGQVSFSGGATGTYATPVDVFVPVNSNQGGTMLNIDLSSASDPVKNIRFVMPEFHTTFANDPFHTDLLTFIEDFQVIRLWIGEN